MIINITGIGNVKFPDGMSKVDIKKALDNNFGKKKEQIKDKSESLDVIKTIVKGVISDQIKPPTQIIPDIKVEPVVEVVTQNTDMQAIAEAVKSVLSKQEPEINVNINNEKSVNIEIIVEDRDLRGNIKKLVMRDIE